MNAIGLSTLTQRINIIGRKEYDLYHIKSLDHITSPLPPTLERIFSLIKRNYPEITD